MFGTASEWSEAEAKQGRAERSEGAAGKRGVGLGRFGQAQPWAVARTRRSLFRRGGFFDGALGALRGHPLGRDARRIGRVTADRGGLVVVRTPLGGRRILDLPYAEPLPRIC